MTGEEDINSAVGLYLVDLDVFVQTLGESVIVQSFDLGNGLTLHRGTRHGLPVWMLDNPHGDYVIRVEDGGRVH